MLSKHSANCGAAVPAQPHSRVLISVWQNLSPLCVTKSVGCSLNASRPVLALSWALFSSPRPHCSQMLGFLHCHPVFTRSWLCSCRQAFLHPSLLPPAFISSLYLFLSHVENGILSTCPFALLSSLLFCPKPTLGWFWAVTFSWPVPTSLLHTDSLNPPFSGQAQPCQRQPLILPSYRQSREPRRRAVPDCDSGSKSSFGQIRM